jgi:hypothetical protein
MAIGNELGLTHELFTQLEQIAREKLEESKQVHSNNSVYKKRRRRFLFCRRKMLVVIIQHPPNYDLQHHIQVKQPVPTSN